MTTPSTSAQGPVAWMWTHEDGSRSFVADPDTKRIWEETMKRVLEPVYTASPSPAASPASPSVDAVAQIIAKWVDEKRYADAPAFQMAAREIIASLASDATPAPTSGSEDGGEAVARRLTILANTMKNNPLVLRNADAANSAIETIRLAAAIIRSGRL